MMFDDQWRIISNRIRGVVKAGELHARFSAVRTDSYGRPRRLREHCEEILQALRKFAEDNEGNLPTAAIEAIRDFITKNATLITDTSGTSELQDDRVAAALVFLSAFEANLTFILSDVQERIRLHSERAFSHLQRSIVADPDMRKKWNKALNSGEIECEKLGGVHLLSHGIYGFKVSGAGERTDLVFQDLVSSLAGEHRFADGLILTEWKIASSESDATNKYMQAKAQAKLYVQGVLSGVELHAYKYLVVVSNRQVRVPSDDIEAGTTFRHINIGVNPMPPSKAAKQ